MPRPISATIHLSALEHNLRIAKQHAPYSKVWAVVKANAYGHGLERGMRGFAAADGLALVEPDGAVKLRELGWQKPILLLEGCFDAADLQAALQYKFDIVVHNSNQIDMLEAVRVPAQVDVHLKMNSGMNRLGFPPEVFRDAYTRLRAIPVVQNITLMTHFANADADHSILPIAEQVRRFNHGAQGLGGERSFSNSAADLMHPEAAVDWVRPGVMLYGGSPGANTAAGFGLLPAMTLSSEIIGIQDIKAGESVGYGSLFVAEKAMRIGIVACGYADGYPRHAPTGTPVLVDGIRTSLIGRVSMDLITVDLTMAPTAHIGSKVVLWGRDLPIDEVANAAGTIGYELMCALAPRVAVVEE